MHWTVDNRASLCIVSTPTSGVRGGTGRTTVHIWPLCAPEASPNLVHASQNFVVRTQLEMGVPEHPLFVN